MTHIREAKHHYVKNSQVRVRLSTLKVPYNKAKREK